MSTPSGGQSSRHQLDIAAVPDALSSIRLFYWSVRRELWENRAIWIWPLAVAGAVLLGLLLSTLDLRHNLHAWIVQYAHDAPGRGQPAAQLWFHWQGQYRHARWSPRTNPGRRHRFEIARGLGHDTRRH